MAGTTSVTTRRIGYSVAIAVNGVMLVIVNNILAWGWLSWLTDDFELLLPIINLSLVASIVANLFYLAYDADWFKTLGDTVLLVISMAVAVRTWQVFPFDFTGWSFDWALAIRAIIALALFGMTIALIVNIVKLVGFLVRLDSTRQQPSH